MNVDKISNRANTELRMWTETLSQARGNGRVSAGVGHKLFGNDTIEGRSEGAGRGE